MTYSIRTTTLVSLALIIGLPSFASALTPDQACHKGRIDAATRFLACQQKLISKALSSGSTLGLDSSMAKCRVKYAAAWIHVQAKASGNGSICDGPRFVDNGSTVTDVYTGLQWEKKTTDASVQDVGLIFRLNENGDGSAYTSLLSTLTSGCFAGSCDWRIPTLAELQTIYQEPCLTTNCIDPAFGPSFNGRFWSSTPNIADLEVGWTVNFLGGTLEVWDRGFDYRVRAVRGGLL